MPRSLSALACDQGQSAVVSQVGVAPSLCQWRLLVHKLCHSGSRRGL